MEVYIIRHGQTEFNRQEKLLGRNDEVITDFGYKQILNAKKLIENIKFDICFSSPYKRTMTTANILLGAKVPILVDKRLSERDFGYLEGGSLNFRYTSEFWNYYLNKSDYEVEPLQELFKRTKTFIDYLKNNYNDKCILIVSHAATIRALHYNIIGYNNTTNMLSFQVNNGQIFKYHL